MPRKVNEERLDTRAARRTLKRRARPYFRVVRRGSFPVHLGYYKQADGRPGTWIGRRYLGDQRYETESLGAADDDPKNEANGSTVLSFDQAVKAAAEWADGQVAKERATAAAASSPTVRKAVLDYIDARKARSYSAGRDAELRLSHHVLAAPLADLTLVSLTDSALTAWRQALKRGGRGVSDDAPPLAPTTQARLLNDFRAALNATARKARLPADVLTTIREGLCAPEAPDQPREHQILDDDAVRRLIEAAYRQDEDFGALVLVLAAVGCRFGQAARATVADLQHSLTRLMVPMARKGRGTKPQTHVARPLPADVMERLHGLAAGRKASEQLLLRWHHRQVAGNKADGRLPVWERVERRRWTNAAEMQRAWRAALVAAEMPADLVPYCLRHSSIVRGLKAGLPVRLVAAAHDTSVAMIEQHYGAFIVDAAEDLLRRAAVPLTSAREG